MGIEAVSEKRLRSVGFSPHGCVMSRETWADYHATSTFVGTVIYAVIDIAGMAAHVGDDVPDVGAAGARDCDLGHNVARVRPRTGLIVREIVEHVEGPPSRDPPPQPGVFFQILVADPPLEHLVRGVAEGVYTSRGPK